MKLAAKLYTIEAIADNADMDLFCKMANPHHCLQYLLLNLVTTTSDPKDIYNYELYRCDSEMHKKSFVPHCVFKYM